MRATGRLQQEARYFAGFFVRALVRFIAGLRFGSAPVCGFGGVLSITQSTSSGLGSGASTSCVLRFVIGGCL